MAEFLQQQYLINLILTCHRDNSVLFCSFSLAPDLMEHGHLPIQITPPCFLQHLFFFFRDLAALQNEGYRWGLCSSMMVNKAILHLILNTNWQVLNIHPGKCSHSQSLFISGKSLVFCCQ